MNKLSSEVDVDRCVDEKQNSDSGSVGKPPSPHVEGKLAASETDDGQTGLLPCPCCGFPPQVLEDYKCFGFGVAGWQIRCDKCGLQTCWWHSLKEAISHWNTRASDTSNAPTQDTESGVSPAVSVDAVEGSFPHQSESESSPSTSVSEAEDKNLGEGCKEHRASVSTERAAEAADSQSGQPMKIERLVLSIATNQFTVPLPTGKEIVRAVNAHDALVAALVNATDIYHREHKPYYSAFAETVELGSDGFVKAEFCKSPVCSQSFAALALANTQVTNTLASSGTA